MGGCVISQIYMSKTSFVQPPQGMAMNALRMKIGKRSSISRKTVSELMLPYKQVKSTCSKLANVIYHEIYFRMCLLLNASLVASCCSTRCSMHLVFVSKGKKGSWGVPHKSTPLRLPKQALNQGDFIGYDHTEVICLPNLGLAGCHSVFKAHLCGTRMLLSSQSSKITRNSRQQW